MGGLPVPPKIPLLNRTALITALQSPAECLVPAHLCAPSPPSPGPSLGPSPASWAASVPPPRSPKSGSGRVKDSIYFTCTKSHCGGRARGVLGWGAPPSLALVPFFLLFLALSVHISGQSVERGVEGSPWSLYWGSEAVSPPGTRGPLTGRGHPKGQLLIWPLPWVGRGCSGRGVSPSTAVSPVRVATPGRFGPVPTWCQGRTEPLWAPGGQRGRGGTGAAPVLPCPPSRAPQPRSATGGSTFGLWDGRDSQGQSQGHLAWPEGVPR